MTKAEIVNTIVLETGINKKDVMAIVENLMEEIKNSLCIFRRIPVQHFR